MKRLFLIPMLFLSFSLFSMELKEGLVKIIIHEDSGSFSVYYLDDISKNKYVPLLFDKDPETSVLSLMINNDIIEPAKSSGFTMKVAKVANGASITWESKNIRVTETFSFLKSDPASLSDGIKISIVVDNISERSSLIGIGYLLDTYLGESQNSHFTLDNGTKITSETSYSSQFPSYWVSPSSKTGVKGLQGMVRGPGITVPDRIVFANWKRLQDDIWNYQSQKSRNFNLLPYSINDSAVSVIYNPIRVSSNSSREVVLAIGGYTESSFKVDIAVDDSEIDTLFSETLNTETDPQDLDTSVKSDLIAVSDLIKKIDTFLEYPENVSESEIELLEQILNTLKQRQNLYEDR